MEAMKPNTGLRRLLGGAATLAGLLFFFLAVRASRETPAPTVGATPFSVEAAREVFPTAAAVSPAGKGLYIVADAHGTPLGTLLHSPELTAPLQGYSGPTPLLLGFGPDGKLRAVALLPNSETPEFLDLVKAAKLLSSWDALGSAAAAKKHVDTVSGATYSSKAIIGTFEATLAAAGEKAAIAAQPVPFKPTFSWTALGLCLYLTAAVFLFFQKRSGGWGYWATMLASVGFLGFASGLCLSLELFCRWTCGGPSLGLLLALAVIVLALELSTGRSFHCVHVCPYGAAQALLARLPLKRPAVSAKVQKAAKFTRLGFLLAAGAAVALAGMGASSFEPFAAFKVFAGPTLFLALAFLLVSAFVPRCWCRFLCPTGTLLGEVRGLFRRSLPPWLAPLFLAFAAGLWAVAAFVK